MHFYSVPKYRDCTKILELTFLLITPNGSSYNENKDEIG